MNERAPLKDPDEYRKRAERCRRLADVVPATRDDLLMAAATWEELADQVEALLRSKKALDSN